MASGHCPSCIAPTGEDQRHLNSETMQSSRQKKGNSPISCVLCKVLGTKRDISAMMRFWNPPPGRQIPQQLGYIVLVAYSRKCYPKGPST